MAQIPIRESLFGSGKVLGVMYLACFLVVALLVLIPLLALVIGSLRNAAPGLPGSWTLANWGGLLSRGVIGTFATTIGIGLASSLASAFYGTAIAFILHRTDIRLARLLAALVSLSFFLPSFILAMAWIIIGSPGGLINGLLQDVLGIQSTQLPDANTTANFYERFPHVCILQKSRNAALKNAFKITVVQV
jgi:iron(III) transport system permease protein